MHVESKVLVSENRMKINDDTLLLLGKSSSPNIRPQIICPSESATLSTPIQTS